MCLVVVDSDTTIFQIPGSLFDRLKAALIALCVLQGKDDESEKPFCRGEMDDTNPNKLCFRKPA